MDAVLSSESRDGLRRAALTQRNSLSKTDVHRRSQQIQRLASELDCYRVARAVALYSPIQNEVDTGTLLDHALSSGKRVFLPRSTKQGFSFARITSRSELVAGRYGILEPVGGTALTAADAQDLLVFVPGVVFDVHGNRLGRGGGVYDRLLAQLNNRNWQIGLAFEFQVVEAVPAEPWDRSVGYVITENGVIDCCMSPSQKSVGR